MKAKWGTYEHDQNELAVRCEYRSIFDKFQRRIGEQVRFTLIGRKRANSQAALTTKLNDLFTAYQSDYKDFYLYLDDGSTETTHKILSSATFGGTKVVAGPNFLSDGIWGASPEYANQRTYYVVLQAETRVGTGLYAWRERISIRGTGAAKWRYSPQITGAPQLQILQDQTSFWYIQEGSAIGRTNYVAPSAPLFPSIEHADMREISYATPEQIVVGGQELFYTGWKYFFEATTSAGFSAFVVPSVTA